MKEGFSAGNWEVFPSTNEIRREGEIRHLEPKVMDLLVCLSLHHGEVLTKERLIQAVWPDTFVGDEVLTSALRKLRAALDDDANDPRYIRTIPRRGYQLVAEVRIAKDVEADSRPADGTRGVGAASLSGILRRHRLLASGTVVLLLALGALAVWFVRRETAPILERGDEILITEFVNMTGDEVFDGALRTALRVKLDESPYINIASDTAIQEALGYMEKPPETSVTPELGREVCQRLNDRAMLVGQIARVGTVYLVALTAEDCRTGDLLVQTEAEASDKDGVLGALDEAATLMRQALGESLASVEKINTPLEEATTSSLDALKALTRALRMNRLHRYREAINFARRATELDPAFALAYWALAGGHWNVQETSAARDCATRAFRYRERASELERLLIDENYHFMVTGDLDRGIQILEVATLTYPEKVGDGWNNLGQDYTLTGQYEKALNAFLRSAALPGRRNALRLRNLAWSYMNLGRLSEAKATLETAISEGHETAEIHRILYRLAWVEGDSTETQRHAAWVDAHPDEDGMAEVRVGEASLRGRFKQARQLLDDYVLSLEQQNRKEAAADQLAWQGWREAVVGNRDMARAFVRRAMESPEAGTRTRVGAAYALAAIGDLEQAPRIAKELSQEYPSGTVIQSLSLPTVLALEALQQGCPELAVERLRPALRFGPQPAPSHFCPQPAPNYVRGMALLALKRWEAAAAEFHAILEHPGRSLEWNSIDYPAALVGLARSKAQMGDVAGARQSYEQFLELWRDADPGIPLLREAKAEFKTLQN